MGANLKATLDTFTAGATKFVQLGEELRDYVDLYDAGGLGRVAVHLHRYVQVSGDANARVLGVRRDKLALAYLATPTMRELRTLGNYDFFAIEGSLTLEVKNQDTHFFADGYLI